MNRKEISNKLKTLKQSKCLKNNIMEQQKLIFKFPRRKEQVVKIEKNKKDKSKFLIFFFCLLFHHKDFFIKFSFKGA